MLEEVIEAFLSLLPQCSILNRMLGEQNLRYMHLSWTFLFKALMYKSFEFTLVKVEKRGTMKKTCDILTAW